MSPHSDQQIRAVTDLPQRDADGAVSRRGRGQRAGGRPSRLQASTAILGHVIWDELPGEFTEGDVASAAGEAGVLEHEQQSLFSLSDVFKKRGEELKSGGMTWGLLLIVDGLTCDYMLTRGDGRERWGPLGPMMEFGDGVYPPPVDSIPDAVRSYLTNRVSSTSRADLRARHCDVVWLRWKSFEHAKLAHGAYLEAASHPDFADAVSTMTAAEYLTRAAELSLELDIDRDGTIQALRDAIAAGLDHEGGGYVWTLVEGGARLVARRPGTASELVDAIAAKADDAEPGPRQRALLDSAEKLARSISDHARARTFQLARAVSLEHEAEARASEGGLIELVLLQDAQAEYSRAGASKEVQRLKPRLAAASERATEGLHEISSSISVPRAEFEDVADEMVGRLGDGLELLLGTGDFVGLWPAPGRVAESLDEATRKFPMSFLVRHTSVSPDGRFAAEPATDPERREAQLTRHLAQQTASRIATLGTVVGILRVRELWSAKRLTEAAASVESELGDACREGFEALEGDRSWTALHALIPQLERAVRLVAVESGVAPFVYETAGMLRFESLDKMLSRHEVLDALGPRLGEAMRRLFVDPYGPNYRNETSHGLMDPAGSVDGAALLTAVAIMSTCVRLAVARSHH